jgi:glutaredoxin
MPVLPGKKCGERRTPWILFLIVRSNGILPRTLVLKLIMNIRLFIKPNCPWCHKAVAWLDERGLKYARLDVIADSKAFTEMINLSGQRFAPVIEVDGKILADFGPEELAEFWKQFEAERKH